MNYHTAHGQLNYLLLYKRIVLFFLLFILLLFLLIFPKLAFAVTYDLDVVEDTYVHQNYPSSNYGSNNILVSDGRPLTRVFLKFDISGVSGNVTSAVLQVIPLRSRPVQKNIHVTSSSWSESEMVWTNQPSLGSLISNLNQEVESGTVVSIDVTNAFNQNTGSELTIAIDDTVRGDQLALRSKDAPTVSPKLIITTSTGSTTSVLQGDANNDGEVNEIDYEIWRQNVGTQTQLGVSVGDFNNNNIVDGVDYNIWWSNFGIPTTVTPTSGPESSPTPTPKATSTPQPNATSTPVPTVPPSSTGHVWISPQEIASLPTSGSAWNSMKNVADNLRYQGVPEAYGGHNSNHDTATLALSYVAARLNDTGYYNAARDSVMDAIGTETNCGSNGSCNSLSLARNLASYVIAADVIDLRNRYPNDYSIFRNWVEKMLDYDHPAGGGCGSGHCSIRDKHTEKPNNHGTMAAASRAAADVWLGDSTDLRTTASIYREYLGLSPLSSAGRADFSYGALWWQCDPNNPVGINPRGCSIQGHSVDGVLPEEQRRCGSGFNWPPCKTGYNWEGMQGLVVMAHILYRNGYSDVFNWGDQALLRTTRWLYTQADDPIAGDDWFQAPLIDRAYGTNYWDGRNVGGGKNMGWTDWTHR